MLIDLIKDTSLVYTITVIDLMAKANIAAARFHFVEAYCVVLGDLYRAVPAISQRHCCSVERFLSARWQGNKKECSTVIIWEGILKNKILLVSALTLAMGIQRRTGG